MGYAFNASALLFFIILFYLRFNILNHFKSVLEGGGWQWAADA